MLLGAQSGMQDRHPDLDGLTSKASCDLMHMGPQCPRAMACGVRKIVAAEHFIIVMGEDVECKTLPILLVWVQ